MSAVCSIDPGAREALLRELRGFAGQLRSELGAVKVILFGSLARGDQHEGSDIDILVVADFSGRSLDLVGEVLRRTNLPVEPLVVRPATYRRRLRQGHPLFVRIAAEGVSL